MIPQNTIATPVLTTYLGKEVLIKKTMHRLVDDIRQNKGQLKKQYLKNKNNLVLKKFNISVENKLKQTDFVQEINHLCQQYKQDQRWILMIDPPEQEIKNLNNSSNIDTTKILRVDTKKVKLAIKNIEMTLTKGNCCAIILCDTNFDQQQLSAFSDFAMQGNTQCIIVNNKPRLH